MLVSVPYQHNASHIEAAQDFLAISISVENHYHFDNRI